MLIWETAGTRYTLYAIEIVPAKDIFALEPTKHAHGGGFLKSHYRSDFLKLFLMSFVIANYGSSKSYQSQKSMWKSENKIICKSPCLSSVLFGIDYGFL